MNNSTLHRVMVIGLLMFLQVTAFAQSGELRGRITDKQGNAVPGATIIVVGTNLSTSADGEGKYHLSNVPVKAHRVSVNMIGFVTQEQSITINQSANTFDFILDMDASNLEEVVIIGYGTQKKGDLTGSMTTVSSKDFQKGAITTPEQLITGKVAGVQITSGGGQPGAASTIRVRAGASLNASNDPLIVIDGVPLSSSTISGVANPLSLINPADIETFTVLKDANATAIYGSRASNGVILITTKKGASGQPKINFSSQNSLAKAAAQVDLMSADQIREYVNATGTEAQIASLGESNTDWQDQIYRQAFSTDNSVSVAGSIKPNLPYRVSMGYLNQQGILKRDNLDRTTAAINFAP